MSIIRNRSIVLAAHVVAKVIGHIYGVADQVGGFEVRLMSPDELGKGTAVGGFRCSTQHVWVGAYPRSFWTAERRAEELVGNIAHELWHLAQWKADPINLRRPTPSYISERDVARAGDWWAAEKSGYHNPDEVATVELQAQAVSFHITDHWVVKPLIWLLRLVV
jgi:hypothetical protein